MDHCFKCKFKMTAYPFTKLFKLKHILTFDIDDILMHIIITSKRAVYFVVVLNKQDIITFLNSEFQYF